METNPLRLRCICLPLMGCNSCNIGSGQLKGRFTSRRLRASFAPHKVDGWNIFPSLDHYRCYNCYIPSTAGTRDAISVNWFPYQIPFPKVITDDYLTQTAEDMLDLIRKKLAPTRKKTFPSLTYGSKLLNAYTEMAKLLQLAPEMPLTPQIPAPPPRL